MINDRSFVSPKIKFGKQSIHQLESVLISEGIENNIIYFIDSFFKGNSIIEKLFKPKFCLVFYVDTIYEPKTSDIDNFVSEIKNKNLFLADAIIGFGGGSVMDVAKAVSLLLTNKGKSEDYQGWDLVKNNGIYKVGIPTISGTGSEVSRTTVLTGPVKKQGINTLKSMFDYIILDPDLLETVPKAQEFYTAMDCYIHSVEALNGCMINNFSMAYAQKGLNLCENYFLGDLTKSDLMIASMFGGYSIVYSEVGVCHALSYGISMVYGIAHGEANCIVFNQLADYYPNQIEAFRKMIKLHGIKLRKNLTRNIDEKSLDIMVNATLLMEKPLYNALGPNWRTIFTKEKIIDLYLKM